MKPAKKDIMNVTVSQNAAFYLMDLSVKKRNTTVLGKDCDHVKGCYLSSKG